MESGFAQRPTMMIFYKYYLQSILFPVFIHCVYTWGPLLSIPLVPVPEAIYLFS